MPDRWTLNRAVASQTVVDYCDRQARSDETTCRRHTSRATLSNDVVQQTYPEKLSSFVSCLFWKYQETTHTWAPCRNIAGTKLLSTKSIGANCSISTPARDFMLDLITFNAPTQKHFLIHIRFSFQKLTWNGKRWNFKCYNLTNQFSAQFRQFTVRTIENLYTEKKKAKIRLLFFFFKKERKEIMWCTWATAALG